MATVPEIQKQLEELGIEFDSKLKKSELLTLLEAQEHKVTEEDLVANPELAKDGIVVGEVIYLPVEVEENLSDNDEEEKTTDEEKPVAKKDPVIGTFEVSNKLKPVYYIAELKDPNGKPCVQIQCLDGSSYRVSVEDADKRLKLK